MGWCYMQNRDALRGVQRIPILHVTPPKSISFIANIAFVSINCYTISINVSWRNSRGLARKWVYTTNSGNLRYQHTNLIEAMPINSKDRHVLAAAVACKAQIIVTQNLRDFPNDVLRPFKVIAFSPDEFLTKLFLLKPDRVTEIIVEQANDLRNPPMSVAEVLATLAQHAPNFVWLVREKIDNSQY